MKRREKLFLGVLVVFFAIGASITHARSLDEIMKSGEIRVGINPTIVPLGLFNAKNEIDGFDKDFAEAVAERLGVKLKVVQVGSPDRIPYVATDKVDFVMGAMTRTPERAKVIDFTLPVHTEVLGVLTTDKVAFDNYKEFNREDVTLVEVRGSTPVQFIQKNLPKAKLLLLDNQPDCIRSIAQGRAHAIIDVIDFIWKHTKGYKNVNWKVVKTPITVYYCCLGVSKGNYSLRYWLNTVIYELHREGFIDTIWEKWFEGPMINKVQWTEWF